MAEGLEVLRILIAEDHALVRAGLRALLSQDLDFEIVGEAVGHGQIFGVHGSCKSQVRVISQR